MKYKLFIDETGDHGLSNVDESFPIFLIGAVYISVTDYDILNKAISELKIKHFGTEDVILHSRDIRKMQHEYKILFNNSIKSGFYNDINALFDIADFTIIPAGILKSEYISIYGLVADNPYDIALNAVLERAAQLCIDNQSCDCVDVIIERRGSVEDAALLATYHKILSRGTKSISAEDIRRTFSSITFKKKSDNEHGLQLSDIVSYPIARHILGATDTNMAYNVLKDNIIEGGCVIYP